MSQEFNIGPVIKRIRMEKGIKARHLSNRLKISPSTLSKYESNERKIKADMIPLIAEELGVTVEYLYSQKVDDTPTNIKHTA